MTDIGIKMTITDELKTAADKLRTTAYGALSGPWQSLDDGDRLIALNDTGRAWATVLEEPVGHAGTAAWIALANPELAQPLADWLESAAKEFITEEWTDCPTAACAVAVARVINGTTPQEVSVHG